MKGTWALSEKELFLTLGTSRAGLSAAEAAARLARQGLNELPAEDGRTWFGILVSQFQSPLIYILAFAALAAIYLGDVVEGSVILAIIAINAGLGFFQEYKSENALQKLRKYVSFTSAVVRDGVEKEADSTGLVVGDAVVLRMGDKVPADVRLVECEDFEVTEAALTGESMPVRKHAAPIPKEKPASTEFGNTALMGSIVTRGKAVGVVVSTGAATLLGRTSVVLSAKVPPTSFETGISEFGGLLVKITAAMTVFVFIVNTLLGRGLLVSFLFALALAVGITPEALPVVITVALSTGGLELARRKVVVKKLAVIENLGNVDILCADKTGTLTENEMVLEKAVAVDGRESAEVLEYGLACSTLAGQGRHSRFKNPYDAAVARKAAELLGRRKADGIAAAGIEGEVGFDFDRKRMSVVVKRRGRLLLVTKGSSESVVGVCSGKLAGGRKAVAISSSDRRVFEQYASAGYSVLAVAVKEVGRKSKWGVGDERGLALAGFLLFASPPRKTTAHTAAELKKLGVELKILTGDGPLVTRKLCSDVGIELKGGRVVLGSELEGLGEDALAEVADRHNVFARVTPEQKYSIVLALRKRGHAVGFIGDGVNDAPALRAADVGISVNTAVDVAKDAAHVIMLNKSLESVLTGIQVGRKIFGNITKYILNTISANFGNMFTVAISSVFLKFIPLLPSQILLNNLVSDVPLLTVSTDNVDAAYLTKPKKWDLKMISRFMVAFGFLSFVFDALTIIAFAWWLQVPEDPFRTAWFLESVLSEIIVTFAIRTSQPFYRSRPSRLLLGVSALAAVFSVAILYISPLASVFSFVPLPPFQLAVVAAILALYFAAAEVCKRFFFSATQF